MASDDSADDSADAVTASASMSASAPAALTRPPPEKPPLQTLRLRLLFGRLLALALPVIVPDLAVDEIARAAASLSSVALRFRLQSYRLQA